MDEQLTEGEQTVLRELLRLEGKNSAAKIAGEISQSEERVTSILNALSQKGLVFLEAEEHVSYSLTQEGEEYAEKGLPEKRLFDAVRSKGGSCLLDEAVKVSGLSQKEKGIAVNWARRNGWVQIRKEDGSTVLVAEEEEIQSPVQTILSEVKSGRSVGESDPLKQALDRRLIQEMRAKTIQAEVTPSHVDAVKRLLSSGTEGIGDLTQEMLLSGSWRGKKFRSYNVESVPPVTNRGKKNPYAEFNDWLREILVGLGFTEWFGPYVETEFWNNDTLFVPQDHVAREVQDQFRVGSPYDHGTIPDKKYYRAVKAVHENGGDTGSTGWQTPFSKEVSTRLCLRSHTTPVSMRYLWEHRDSPQKMFIIDRNFRCENLSARHAQEFNQCEGIILDQGLNLRDLMGYLSEICRRVGIKKIKFKPGQFPFTEPSVECFAKHDILGWIEVAPGGIFRPEVTRPLGITDPVLAWGIGSGRLYMAAMGIGDIRELYTRDLQWLRRSYFVR
ncbi:MAG: phenylalanine--tRNA ligase subunit alpha [Candidatus Thorarchaeota archaeon]|nr:MAG: phenylalanine--tRNA ligase subunit alpha [Candidatus Thorarchaeota archaeon]